MNTFFSLSISLVVFLFFSVVAAHCGDGVCDSTVVARCYLPWRAYSTLAGCGDCGVIVGDGACGSIVTACGDGAHNSIVAAHGNCKQWDGRDTQDSILTACGNHGVVAEGHKLWDWRIQEEAG
jgi:hypothetical protein